MGADIARGWNVLATSQFTASVTSALPTRVLMASRATGRTSTHSGSGGRPNGHAPSTKPRRVGRYVLANTLGEGGMATVSLAKLAGEGGFSRPVAVKQLLAEKQRDEKLVAALLEEARLVSFIRHPNVVPVIDVVGEPGGPLLVVMEYVFGDALSGLLHAAEARHETIPVSIAAAIAIGVLEGLHAAHEARDTQGVPIFLVHRDVSPQNILVGVDGVARVTDFGIAKALGRNQETTAHGVAKGKVRYMPSEQFAGGPVDRRADVWATGVVLWEMLTGRAFFPDASSMRRYHLEIDNTEAPSVYSATAAPLDEVVLRALARAPEARFASARDMAIAIEKAVTPASSRRVGQLVRRLAREKLANGEADLRDLGATSVPMESSSSPTQTAPTIKVGSTVSQNKETFMTPEQTLISFTPLPARSSSPTIPSKSRARSRWKVDTSSMAMKDHAVPIALTVLLALVIATGAWLAAGQHGRGAATKDQRSPSTATSIMNTPMPPVMFTPEVDQAPSAAAAATASVRTTAHRLSTPSPSVSSAVAQRSARAPRRLVMGATPTHDLQAAPAETSTSPATPSSNAGTAPQRPPHSAGASGS